MGCTEVENRPIQGEMPGNTPVPTLDAGNEQQTGAQLDAGSMMPAPPSPPAPSTLTMIEARVVGHYALKMHTANMMSLPFVGNTEQRTVSWGLVEIIRQGDQFVMTEVGCHVESKAGQSITTIIPDLIPRSIPKTEKQVIFEMDGEDIKWSRSDVVTLIGVKMDDPMNDPMPMNADAPSVFDHEPDGHPGATISLESVFANGDIYVAQRTRVAFYDGYLNEQDQLRALVHNGGEQVVLGASTPILRQQLPTEDHPDPTQNHVQLHPIASGYDCDRLLNEVDTIFPANN